MSVVLDVSVPTESFALGQVLSTASDVRVELERLVPMGADRSLHLWARGTNRSAFTRSVRSDPRVDAFVPLEECDERTLYRLELSDTTGAIVTAVCETDAVIVRGTLDEEWQFRFRFPDHDRMSTFHDRCRSDGVPIRVDRVDRTNGDGDRADVHGLSDPQREALVVALERGYFATPSETDLEALASEFDISHQALSSRLRRGLEAVLTDALRNEIE